MNIPSTDIHASGPAIKYSTNVIYQLHWCLLNFLWKVTSNYQLFFYGKHIATLKKNNNS